MLSGKNIIEGLFCYILKVRKPEDISAESLALFTIMEPPIGMPL